MKGIISLAMLCCVTFAMNSYAKPNQPFQVRVSQHTLKGVTGNSTYVNYSFHALDDNIAVMNVTANGGRCHLPYKYKPKPILLKYGEPLVISELECSFNKILEIYIETKDHGNWTWN